MRLENCPDALACHLSPFCVWTYRITFSETGNILLRNGVCLFVLIVVLCNSCWFVSSGAPRFGVVPVLCNREVWQSSDMTYLAVNDPNITSGFTFNERSVSLASELRSFVVLRPSPKQSAPPSTARYNIDLITLWSLDTYSPWRSFQIRGGFRGEGGGRGRGGEGGPRPPLSSGSGIFWDNVLEWYMNLYEPTDSIRRNVHKNIAFAKLLPVFPEIYGTRFQNFPGGACPRTSLAYECLHVCYEPPLQNAHRSPCVNQEI